MTEKKGEKGGETLKPELGVGALSRSVFMLIFRVVSLMGLALPPPTTIKKMWMGGWVP